MQSLDRSLPRGSIRPSLDSDISIRPIDRDQFDLYLLELDLVFEMFMIVGFIVKRKLISRMSYVYIISKIKFYILSSTDGIYRELISKGNLERSFSFNNLRSTDG